MNGRPVSHPAAPLQSGQGAICRQSNGILASIEGRSRFWAGKYFGFSMLPQALQLIPYVAIASAILLGIAIVMICLNQGSRRIDFGVSWRQPILSVFQRFWLVMSRTRPRQPGVIIHDPDLSKPHDLDDPLFDPNVRERIGVAIANAVLRKAKP